MQPLDPWDSGSFRLSPSLCLILLIRPFVELYRRLGRCLVHETVGDRENQYLEELFRLVDVRETNNSYVHTQFIFFSIVFPMAEIFTRTALPGIF